MKGLPEDDALKGLVDDEDLFDFASLESATAALEADELGVEEFLAAVERLDEPDAALPSESEEFPADSLSDVMESAERAASAPETAPAESLAPAPKPAAATPEGAAPGTVVVAAGPARLSPVLLAVAAAVLLLNGAISLVAWNSSQVAARELATARDLLGTAAEELVDGIDNEIDRIDRSRAPIVAPSALAMDGLGHVNEAIARGDFALARLQVYSKLATIDRIEASQRSDFEARASFLLGDIDRLEAEQMRAGGQQ